MTTGSNDKLVVVRRKFIAASKQRADKIEEIMGVPEARDKHNRLQHLALKIAGSAGFFGEHRIAEVAARIDTGLQTNEYYRDSAAVTADINELLSLLRAL